MPLLAKMIAIPKRYIFHGVSYFYLMEELTKQLSTQANSHIILTHFGSGTSLAAVLNGRSIDTTRSFTPAAGLLKGTRSGDIDPGLVSYMAKSEKMTPRQISIT